MLGMIPFVGNVPFVGNIPFVGNNSFCQERSLCWDCWCFSGVSERMGASLPAFFGNVSPRWDCPVGLSMREGDSGTPLGVGSAPADPSHGIPGVSVGLGALVCPGTFRGQDPGTARIPGIRSGLELPAWRFGDATGRGRRAGQGLRGFPGAAFEVSAADLVLGWVEAPPAGVDRGILLE